MHNYIRALDGVRAVAIAFVFVQHFAFYIGRKINAGFIGVDLFFVLSGFLITGILINAKGSFGQAYKNFLGRRALRIFPLYYSVLLLMLLFNTAGARDWWLYLATYTFNYATVAHDIPILPVTHFWSLAVEEQFYLLWPLLVLTLRNQIVLLKILMGAGMMLCILHFVLNLFPSVQPYNFVGLFPRMLSLLTGGMAALYFSKLDSLTPFLRNNFSEVLMWGGLLACMLIRSDVKMAIFPFVAILFILKAITNTFAIKSAGDFLINSRVVLIGKISYGLYIFHLPIAFWFSEKIFNPLWASIPFDSWGAVAVVEQHSYIIRLPLYSFFTFCMAWVSYQYFEKPILRLKDRFFSMSSRA